jgi:hypothetical protein
MGGGDDGGSCSGREELWRERVGRCGGEERERRRLQWSEGGDCKWEQVAAAAINLC